MVSNKERTEAMESMVSNFCDCDETAIGWERLVMPSHSVKSRHAPVVNDTRASRTAFVRRSDASLSVLSSCRKLATCMTSHDD